MENYEFFKLADDLGSWKTKLEILNRVKNQRPLELLPMKLLLEVVR